MEKLKINCSYEYRTETIPPRCRKPRIVDMNGKMTLNIPIIGIDEAPVVMKYKELHEVVEFRSFRKKLFVKMTAHDFNCQWTGKSTAEMLIHRFSHQRFFGIIEDEEAAKKELRKKAHDYFILDGEVWERKGEPRYCIYTFGLGHNHAETCVSISTYFNSNIPKERYFSALEYDAAIEKAVEIAKTRGDTNSIDRIKQSEKIEVLDPSAVKVKPRLHKGGNRILDHAEAMINGSSSAAEAALLLMATMR